MNSYRTTSGERLNQSTIDNLIRKAKAKKLQNHLDDFGYIFCEKCKKSGGSYFDCSHNISVKKCKENGETEKAFDVDNITILCRSCHQKHDKLN